EADYLVRVEDAESAALLSWDGATWITQTLLSDAQYRLSYGQVGDSVLPVTDIYLPFDLLGIVNPLWAEATMLAVASDEEALQLWTVFPELNLVDSARAVNPLAAVAGAQQYMLVTAYHWQSLGPGLCPYQLALLQPLEEFGFLDRDLRANLSAEPDGTSYSLVGDDLAWQWAQIFLEPGPKSEGFRFLDHSHRPLGQGQLVTYTLQVENHGMSPAEGIKALVSAYYGLLLPAGTPDPENYRDWQVVEVGDVSPGEAVTATFTALVEVEANARYDRCLYDAGLPPEICRLLLESAVVDVLLLDASATASVLQGIPLGLPLDWLWSDHSVDLDPPQRLSITEPGATVQPGLTTIRGTVADPSGVPLIEVEVRDAGDASTVLNCPDTEPEDGWWSCPWTVSGADGDPFDLRVRATDGLGHVSAWSIPWHTTIVDTAPPTVTLSAEAYNAVQGQVLGRAGAMIGGEIADDHGSASVEICHQGSNGTLCEPATLLLASQALTDTASTYDPLPLSAAPLDSTTTCGSGEITRTFTVVDEFFVGDVDLGFNVTHPAREEIVVELISPVGTRARLIYPDGSTYGFENYDVWLDDAAPQPLHVPVDDDPAEPYYDRQARPEAALAAFAGESATGTWTMTVCDLNPLWNDGTYHHAKLSLTPQGLDVSTAGTWSYRLLPAEGADGLAQTLDIFGLDAAGNHTDPPINLNFTGDVVAPLLTVTTQLPQTYETAPEVVLAGTVSDGESVAAVKVQVTPADGGQFTQVASLSQGVWSYTPQGLAPGLHALWVKARDRAGNERALGSFQLEVLPGPYPCHARLQSSGEVYGSTDASAVQRAIDAAAEGDTVQLAGTCSGTQERAGGQQTVYLDKNLTLRGGYNAGDWLVSDPVAEPTILDASGQGRVLFISGDITPTVEGLRLTGGDATGLGGGLSGYDAGGGLYVISATVTLSDCLIQNSVASRTGSGLGGGIYLRYSDSSILGSTVADNTASQAGRGWGGGLYLSQSDAVIRRNTLERNTASLSDEGHGGGLYAFGSRTTIDRDTVRENTASQGSGAAGYGGGISVLQSQATLTGVSVGANVASSDGDGYGGGLYMVAAGGTVSGTTVMSNTATFSHTAASLGGGFYVKNGRPATLTNNVIASNQAHSFGSELWLGSDEGSATEVILLHNSFAGTGQGLYLGSSVTATLTDTIISGYDGSGLYADNSALAELEATLWHANGADSAGPGTIVSQTNVYGDPAFVDPTGGDYHITLSSAAINQGVDAGVGTDIDGQPRPYGSGYDIGADELVRDVVPGVDSFTAVVSGTQILLEWTTITEVDTEGFNLYRALEPGGGKELLTAVPIPSQHPGEPLGADYQYPDGDVEEAVTYYYWLEEVHVLGLTTLHGPASAAVGGWEVYLPLVLRQP
ncbi:MAG: right-handed parallel beta-helix repeat-containing protein, partial [Anaerolineae bacterium]